MINHKLGWMVLNWHDLCCLASFWTDRSRLGLFRAKLDGTEQNRAKLSKIGFAKIPYECNWNFFKIASNPPTNYAGKHNYWNHLCYSIESFNLWYIGQERSSIFNRRCNGGRNETNSKPRYMYMSILFTIVNTLLSTMMMIYVYATKSRRFGVICSELACFWRWRSVPLLPQLRLCFALAFAFGDGGDGVHSSVLQRVLIQWKILKRCSVSHCCHHARASCCARRCPVRTMTICMHVW